MIVDGLYSTKNDCPSTSMFSRADGKEPPKRKSDVAEALGEVAKHVSAAYSQELYPQQEVQVVI